MLYLYNLSAAGLFNYVSPFSGQQALKGYMLILVLILVYRNLGGIKIKAQSRHFSISSFSLGTCQEMFHLIR